ncbi:hypothetical protein ColTof4_11996 [Colletotrichum tofieldiae]|nr:hypothetical protein ColTof4_11996 [Colletotrichum tofieldiae]
MHAAVGQSKQAMPPTSRHGEAGRGPHPPNLRNHAARERQARRDGVERQAVLGPGRISSVVQRLPPSRRARRMAALTQCRSEPNTRPSRPSLATGQCSRNKLEDADDGDW